MEIGPFVVSLAEEVVLPPRCQSEFVRLWLGLRLGSAELG